jgi:hypothetical protein
VFFGLLFELLFLLLVQWVALDWFVSTADSFPYSASLSTFGAVLVSYIARVVLTGKHSNGILGMRLLAAAAIFCAVLSLHLIGIVVFLSVGVFTYLSILLTGRFSKAVGHNAKLISIAKWLICAGLFGALITLAYGALFPAFPLTMNADSIMGTGFGTSTGLTGKVAVLLAERGLVMLIIVGLLVAVSGIQIWGLIRFSACFCNRSQVLHF